MDPIAGLLDGARACRAFQLPRDDVGRAWTVGTLARHARESLAERERVA